MVNYPVYLELYKVVNCKNLHTECVGIAESSLLLFIFCMHTVRAVSEMSAFTSRKVSANIDWTCRVWLLLKKLKIVLLTGDITMECTCTFVQVHNNTAYFTS